MQRRDGRAPDELRPLGFELSYLKHAHGSCIVSFGDTKVLCAANIEDGVSHWRRGKGLGWVTAEYSLLPASTHSRTRREVTRGSLGGRTHEIQRLIGRSLRSVIDMAAMGGEYTMTVDCDVLQADGGTRTAAITGAFVAAHEAFSTWREAGKIDTLPLREYIAAVSVGVVDGRAMLDLDYSEDSVAEVDMNVVMDGRERFIEVQGTGEQLPFDRDRLNELLDLAIEGVTEIVAAQRRAVGEADETGS